MTVPVKLTGKAQERIGQNTPLLCFWVAIACLFVGWLATFGEFTRNARFDGSLGMFLGLYICSHPAANMLDMLLFMTADTRERITATHSGQFWLVLNALTMLAGWVVIFIGALHFVK